MWYSLGNSSLQNPLVGKGRYGQSKCCEQLLPINHNVHIYIKNLENYEGNYTDTLSFFLLPFKCHQFLKILFGKITKKSHYPRII